MNSNPTQARENGLIAATLLVVPPIAAAAAIAVPHMLTLADRPIAWLAGIAATAVAVTTLAAAAESAARREVAGTVWPMLLAWPLAYPYHMATRDRYGLARYTGSGILGAALLAGAIAWSWHRIEEAESAAAYLADTLTGQAISPQPPGERISEEERMRILQRRIDAMLDAEQR